MQFRKSPILFTHGDAERYIQTAREDPNADERRDAIDHLTKTRFADDEFVVQACCSIADRDKSPSVRCAAIRLVAESCRPEAPPTLMSLFGDGSADRKPVATRVRIESLHGLYYLVRNAELEEKVLLSVARLGQHALQKDPSRDARIVAARLLGEFERREVVESLIQSLDDADFGVVYQSEKSLERLTGVVHNRNQRAWRMWLAGVDDPFAGARDRAGGDEESGPWWSRLTSRVRRAFTG